MVKKYIQKYENFPGGKEGRYTAPYPTFKDIYHNSMGFFDIQTTLDLNSKTCKDYNFNFINGRSELQSKNGDIIMGTFRISKYIHNDCDDYGASNWWWPESGGFTYKNFSPSKKYGMYLGLELNSAATMVTDNAWNNGKVLPIPGCVGFSTYHEFLTEFDKNSQTKNRKGTVLGLYLVLCDRNKNVKLAELIGSSDTLSESRTESWVYRDHGRVGPPNDESSQFSASNAKDPYCSYDLDMGYLHGSLGYVSYESACDSSKSFRTPVNTYTEQTYCFTHSTQGLIRERQYAPIGMVVYMGLLDNGTAYTTEARSVFKRNKLLYLPHSYTNTSIKALAYSWGDSSGNNKNDEYKNYHLCLPKARALKHYWDDIYPSKRELATLTF